MSRLSLCLALLLSALWPAGAMAQFHVVLEEVDGQAVTTMNPHPLNQQDCEDNVPVKFKLTMFPSGKSVIDVYQGNDCGLPERTTPDSDCELIHHDDISGVQASIVIGAKTICDGRNEQLWFLPVDSSGSNEEVGTAYFQLNIDIDESRPPAPTGVTGGSGQSEIPVEWDSDEGSETEFVIYVVTTGTVGAPTESTLLDASTEPDMAAAVSDADAGFDPDMDGGSDPVDDPAPDTTDEPPAGDCGQSVLYSGAEIDPDDPPDGVLVIDDISGSKRSYGLSAAQVGGAMAAVAVQAIDDAGNRSLLSDVVCVEVVNTAGLLDIVGDDQTGCPCSAMGPTQIENTWPVAMAVMALGMRRRRLGRG